MLNFILIIIISILMYTHSRYIKLINEGKYRIDKNKFERYKKMLFIAFILFPVTLLFNILIPSIIVDLINILVLLLLIFMGIYLRKYLQTSTEYLGK